MSALSHDILIKTRRARDGMELHASYLANGLVIRGVLDTGGELYIHGNVIGRINADRVVIGTDGHVEGDVVARDVHVEGRLFGRIFAPNVTVDSSALIEGRIFHSSITVAKGARVVGPMPWRPPSYFDSLEQLPEARS
jgi:cytoskeletal protein CcmA (bactofilin family)